MEKQTTARTVSKMSVKISYSIFPSLPYPRKGRGILSLFQFFAFDFGNHDKIALRLAFFFRGKNP